MSAIENPLISECGVKVGDLVMIHGEPGHLYEVLELVDCLLTSGGVVAFLVNDLTARVVPVEQVTLIGDGIKEAS